MTSFRPRVEGRLDRGAAPGPGALLVEIITHGHALIDVADDGTPQRCVRSRTRVLITANHCTAAVS